MSGMTTRQFSGVPSKTLCEGFGGALHEAHHSRGRVFSGGTHIGRHSRQSDHDFMASRSAHGRPLLLALVSGALLFPGNLAAQSGPRTITTQELAQTKTGGNDWITYGGALN